MPIPFPSDAWIKALQETLNTDADYARIANNWEGDLTFVVEPTSSTQPAIYLYMDLWHGKCRDAYLLTDPASKKPAFTLIAPLNVFQSVVQGKLDPMQAMMTRKLKVTGSMAYMMRNVPTILRFVKCATLIDSDFSA